MGLTLEGRTPYLALKTNDACVHENHKTTVIKKQFLMSVQAFSTATSLGLREQVKSSFSQLLPERALSDYFKNGSLAWLLIEQASWAGCVPPQRPGKPVDTSPTFPPSAMLLVNSTSLEAACTQKLAPQFFGWHLRMGLQIAWLCQPTGLYSPIPMP